MGIDLDDLLLIRGEFFGIALFLNKVEVSRVSWRGADEKTNLEADQHYMCLVHQSNNHGSLLHCFLCVFNLEYPPLWGASWHLVRADC